MELNTNYRKIKRLWFLPKTPIDVDFRFHFTIKTGPTSIQPVITFFLFYTDWDKDGTILSDYKH